MSKSTKATVVRAVMGFRTLTDRNLTSLSNGVLKGLTADSRNKRPCVDDKVRPRRKRSVPAVPTRGERNHSRESQGRQRIPEF
jgi:hypothetical protein